MYSVPNLRSLSRPYSRIKSVTWVYRVCTLRVHTRARALVENGNAIDKTLSGGVFPNKGESKDVEKCTHKHQNLPATATFGTYLLCLHRTHEPAFLSFFFFPPPWFIGGCIPLYRNVSRVPRCNLLLVSRAERCSKKTVSEGA